MREGNERGAKATSHRSTAAACVVATAMEQLRSLGYKVSYQLDFGKRGGLRLFVAGRNPPVPTHLLVEQLIQDTKVPPA